MLLCYQDNVVLKEKEEINNKESQEITIDELTPTPNIISTNSPSLCENEDSQTIEIDEQKEEENEDELLNESVINPKKKLVK